MTGWYLAALLVSLGSIALIDRRWRLFLWRDARRAAVVLAAGFALFLTWDLVAIPQGFYERGGSGALIGLEVAPHLPLEELVFITFFVYLTMVLFTGLARVLGARSASRASRTAGTTRAHHAASAEEAP